MTLISNKEKNGKMKNLDVDKTASIFEMIQLLYQAANNPERWPELFTTLRQKLDTHCFYDDIASTNYFNETIQVLLPHFNLALDTGLRLYDAESRQSQLHTVLDKLPLGVAIVDRERKILGMNQIANDALTSIDIISNHNGKIRINNRELHFLLHQHIEAAIELSMTNTLRLAWGHVTQPLSILVAPACELPENTFIERTAVLFIAIPNKMMVNEQILKDLYRLTSAESELTKHIVTGMSLREYAEEMGVSNNTVKTQLKAIFQKTGVNRQAELVSLVINSPAILRNTSIERQRVAINQCYQSLQVDIDKKISYAEYGPQTGEAIFFCHSLRGSRLERPQNLEILFQLGVRLIVIDRPGYGYSSPDPKLDLLAWPNYMQKLADQLNIDRFFVMGFSIGGSYALACAHVLSDRIKKVALLSPISPLEEMKKVKALPASFRFILSLSRRSPQVAARILELVSWDIHRRPEHYLDSFILRDSLSDQQIFKKPDVRAMYLSALKEASRFSTSCIAHDIERISRVAPK